MLTLIATPIGNIDDISERAIQGLISSDAILAEDTRSTEKLLHILEEREKIPPSQQVKKIISYHKFNEQERLHELIELLESGKSLALVSDAGTPAISDPGQKLVSACHAKKIPVSIIPGPCAFVSAFAISGFYAEKFQFIGFLPKNLTERRQALVETLEYEGATVFYESGQRVLSTISLLKELSPLRNVAYIRELTKKFEETLVSSVQELEALLDARYKEQPVKGEIVIVVAPPSRNEQTALSDNDYLQQVFSLREEHNLTLSEACAIVAKTHGLKKKWLYSLVLEKK